MEAEYNQYNERIAQISNPQYAAELKERIFALNQKVKKLEKSKHKMEVNQQKKDKVIIKKVENEPEISQALAELKNEVHNSDVKIKENDQKIDKNANSLQDQNAKMGVLKEQWKKLSDEATSLGIDPNKINEKEGSKTEKIDENSYEGKLAKKLALEKTLNLLKTRYTVNLGDYTQKKIQLQEKVTKMAENIQEKNEYFFNKKHENSIWIKKKEELTDLLAKLKTNCAETLANIMIHEFNQNVIKKPKNIPKPIGNGPVPLSQKNLDRLNSLSLYFLYF